MKSEGPLSRGRVRSATLILALLALFAGGSEVAIGAPAVAAMKVGGDEHKHVWVKKGMRDEWVPAVTKRVVVGKDKNGDPIYEERVIQPGYTKKVPYELCKKCNKERKGG